MAVSKQGGTLDLGLKVLGSHYQQKDGNGVLLGAGPVANSPEKGGDMGGYIIPTVIGVTTYKQTRLIQNATADNSNLGPIARPELGMSFNNSVGGAGHFRRPALSGPDEGLIWRASIDRTARFTLFH